MPSSAMVCCVGLEQGIRFANYLNWGPVALVTSVDRVASNLQIHGVHTFLGVAELGLRGAALSRLEDGEGLVFSR